MQIGPSSRSIHSLGEPLGARVRFPGLSFPDFDLGFGDALAFADEEAFGFPLSLGFELIDLSWRRG